VILFSEKWTDMLFFRKGTVPGARWCHFLEVVMLSPTVFDVYKPISFLTIERRVPCQKEKG